MIEYKIFVRRAPAAAILLAAAAPGVTQTAPRSDDPKLPGPLVPGVGNFSLPATPAPLPTVVPTPAPQPTALPTGLPTGLPTMVPTPVPAATTLPAPVASARPVPIPISTPTPRIAATSPPAPPAPAAPVRPAPVPSATPTPVAAAPAARVDPAAREAPTGPAWPWWALPGIAAALACIALLARGVIRRRAGRAPDRAAAPPPPAPPPPPVPVMPRGQVTLSLRPLRAGLNLLSATVEAELTLANAGTAPATDIQVAVTLLGAHAGQDADLAAAYAQPITRPAVRIAVLAPGETRTQRIVAALARDAIRTMTAAGRPIVVPVVAVNCRYATAGTAAQTAQAFAVGVERVDSARLSPFWLDGPARTYDAVAARPHAAALRS